MKVVEVVVMLMMTKDDLLPNYEDVVNITDDKYILNILICQLNDNSDLYLYLYIYK